MLTLTDLQAAIRASWAHDTCSPDDQARTPWTAENPAWGHCDITALLLNDLVGGDLVLGEVHLGPDRHGYHWWNRLPGGIEIDLTRDQFRLGQTITAARVVRRPPGAPKRRGAEYELFRQRVQGRMVEWQTSSSSARESSA
ncbi:YunG family protein [Asanoa iriomotensis]|nr:hypothetical protein [Asanoa iriomotensis]